MDYPGSEDEEADLEITVNENYCPRWESDQNDTKSPFVSTPPSSPRHSSTLGGSFCLGLSSSSSSQTSSTVSEDILEFGNLPGVKGLYSFQTITFNNWRSLSKPSFTSPNFSLAL